MLTDLGSATHDEAFAVTLQPDGKIVATGASHAGVSFDFALVRYDADGSLDQSFGLGGKLLTGLGSASLDEAFAVTLQPDGKIVATRTSDAGGSEEFALVGYDAGGSPDPSFGLGGKVLTDLGKQSSDIAQAVALQPDGKILATGFTVLGGGSDDFALVRYNADASLDPSFGSGSGEVATDLGNQSSDIDQAVAIQPDGKIVAAGWSNAAGGISDFALVRYDADGSLDSSFGFGGKVLTDLGNQGLEIARAVAIQPDGKVVAAGQSNGGGSQDFALARYLGDVTAMRVAIDIKPGSSTNPIKLSGRGLVPVAVLSTNVFDATTVSPSTVCFGDDDNPSQRDCTEAHGKGHIEDVNGDGRPDLQLHYELSQTGIDPGDTRACLTGKTFAGVGVEGCDSIRTL